MNGLRISCVHERVRKKKFLHVDDCVVHHHNNHHITHNINFHRKSIHELEFIHVSRAIVVGVARPVELRIFHIDYEYKKNIKVTKYFFFRNYWTVNKNRIQCRREMKNCSTITKIILWWQKICFFAFSFWEVFFFQLTTRCLMSMLLLCVLIITTKRN